MALKLEGTARDKRSFLAQIKRCSKHAVKLDRAGNVVWDDSPAPTEGPFVQVLNDLMSSSRAVTLDLKRGKAPPETWFDDFCSRTVYVDHVNKLPDTPPAGHPSATTRCEAWIHILAEYGHALEQDATTCTAGFEQSHQAGIDAQTRYRHSIGQKSSARANEHHDPARAGKHKPAGEERLVYLHCNGTATTVTGKDGEITNVDHGPKEERERPDQSDPKKGKTSLKQLFQRSDVVFSGVIEQVHAAPTSWSSLMLSYQRVTYRVGEILQGSFPGETVDVFHIVVPRSQTASSDRPGLSPQLFHEGRFFLVFARWGEDPDAAGAFRLEARDADTVLALGTREIPLLGGDPSSGRFVPDCSTHYTVNVFNRELVADCEHLTDAEKTAMERALRAKAERTAAAICSLRTDCPNPVLDDTYEPTESVCQGRLWDKNVSWGFTCATS
jgi:hypothetical protein